MNKESFGAFIAQERKAGNLTQRDLADKLHITDKAVSKWERGLSYPDVTLLEPLAEALGLGVEELMACRRQTDEPPERGEEPMKNLLDISNDTVRRERKRSWQRLAGVSVLVLVTAAAIAYSLLTVTEQRQSPVFLKESENGADYIYLVENGHLLKLKCGADVAFDTVTVDDRAYQMDCRWNKLTYEGTVTACEATDTIWLGGLMDVTYEAEQAPMLGESEVYFTSENYYPDPYAEDRGREFLCDFRFWLWRAEDDTTQTILTVKDCKNAVPADYDGDGLNEVVVRTRWPEKPYTVYDMVDGEITEVWPDTIPDEIKEQLVCIWEQ